MTRKDNAEAVFRILKECTKNGTQRCIISKRVICRRLGLSMFLVDQALRDIKDYGYVTVERRFTDEGCASPNEYTLNVKSQDDCEKGSGDG